MATTYKIAYYWAEGHNIDFLPPAANAVLVTDGSSVPAFATTLPAGLTYTGLGTMAAQNANAVSIQGGSISGITTFALPDTSAAFSVILGATSSTALDANRALTLDMKNVAHTLAFGSTANTITFPSAASYTVAALELAQTFTNFISTIGLNIKDQISGFYSNLRVVNSSLTADRSLNINMGNVSHTLSLGTASGTISFPNVGSYTVIGSGDTNTITTGMINSVQAAKVLGTVTNDDAAASRLGEYKFSNIIVASAVALTTATPANVTSLSLTAGDWDVSGTVAFNPAAGTLIVDMKGGISQTSATLPTLSDTAALVDIPLSPSAGVGATIPVGRSRISLAGTTTVYLVAQSTFTVSTCSAYGFISARRVR